jgi:hypothetical protein
MVERGAKVGDPCKELGVTRQTLYRSVDPNCELLPDGARLLERKHQQTSSLVVNLRATKQAEFLAERMGR